MLNCQLRLAQTKTIETFQLTLSKIHSVHIRVFFFQSRETLVHAVRLMSLKPPQIPKEKTATFKATTSALLVIC